MTEAEFVELAQTGERNGVEFKGPVALDDAPHVIRAVLGMANRRDGGLVVVGLGNKGEPEGLTVEQAASWASRDDVRGAFSPYADPPVEFEIDSMHIVAMDDEFNDKRFVILHISQFQDVPIICAKQRDGLKGKPILRRGALYVRSRDVEATVEVEDSDQMREVLELAIDNGVRKWVARTSRAGVELSSAAVPSADELYRKERVIDSAEWSGEE